MSKVACPCGALAAPFVSWDAAEAQASHWALAAPVETDPGTVPDRTGLPAFRIMPGDPRATGLAPRTGLVATLPVADNLHFVVGRFAVPEPAGRRTNVEAERRPTDMRRRERAVAALAVSFSF
jgi:hypothetical protein